jgi:hypothetical protein
MEATVSRGLFAVGSPSFLFGADPQTVFHGNMNLNSSI